MAENGSITLTLAWMGAIAYTLEIYFDFCGYSDMAIGLGQCFGFHFDENFNFPYVATSINDFWKRWHISMTNWFRDYVYIPLGGNRVSTAKNIRNIIIVWALTGIWHGANWTFMLWGIIYCIFQLLEKFVYDVNKWPMFIRRLYTLSIVCLCWVIFKANNVASAFKYFTYMFGTGGFIDDTAKKYLSSGAVIILLGIVFSLPIVQKLDEKISIGKLAFAKEIMKYILLILILTATCFFSISGGYSPFIYFNF